MQGRPLQLPNRTDRDLKHGRGAPERQPAFDAMAQHLLLPRRENGPRRTRELQKLPPKAARALHSPCRSRSERASPASAHPPPPHASRPPRSTPPPRCPVAPFAGRPRRPRTPEAAPRRPSRRVRRSSTAIADSDGVGGSARGPRCTATQLLDSSSTGPGGHACATGRHPTPPRRPQCPQCPHGHLPTPTSIAAPWDASVHSGSVPDPAGCRRRRQRHTAANLFTWRSSVPTQAAGPRGQPPRRSPRQTVKRP